ncbi:MAG: hypothetical protein CMJ46_16865 [Planctomyces sp.]|nr:hypothetical protein [Planctomyces sp.]
MSHTIAAKMKYNQHALVDADALFEQDLNKQHACVDRFFAVLMVLQWVGGIIAAFVLSPFTWNGNQSTPHLHLQAAIIAGGIIIALPIYLALKRPGATVTRHVIAVGQMLTSALLIHISGGRIETHFHIFGSLAFLACYRDWRVLITATVVTAADHFLRGIFYPESVFGVLQASQWRAAEHAAWVVFEDIFLIVTIRLSLSEMREMASQRARLEQTNVLVEEKVIQRTAELRAANAEITKMNEELQVTTLAVQKQAEALMLARRKADELRTLGRILDQSLNEIFLIDLETFKFTYANHGALQNSGYAPEELYEMTPADLNREITIDKIRRLLSPLLCGKTDSVEKQSVFTRKNGTTYPVQLHLELAKQGSRKVVIAIALDVTERIKIQKELHDSHERALAADRSKSEFLANMSHEIRTPMTAILGFAETLLDPDLEPRDHVKSVQTIIRNGQHLLHIINDILDLSKIEAGKMQLEELSTDPTLIIADAVELMKVRLDAKGLSIHCNFEGPIPSRIVTDPTRLRQVLINLIGNSVKFTEEGGITIHARLSREAQPAFFEIDVEDTGCGMESDIVQSLFQPFQQADNSVTRKFGGSGLGLTISRKFAELMGGELRLVSSEKGKGSRFQIRIPTGDLSQTEFNELPEHQLPISPRPVVLPHRHDDELLGVGRRILLVEDGPDNQRLISYLLKKQGFEVSIASNGQEGYETALAAEDADNPFDIILMDMQMPVMDGYAATTALRDASYDRPIIALTAHAMKGDADHCLNAGCDAYATKPINRDSLFELLRTFLPQSNQVAEASIDG